MIRAIGRLAFAMGILFACACAPEPSPLNVPGPTTTLAQAKSSVDVPLPRSVRLVTQPAPDSPSVSFRIAFTSGSSEDPVGKEGLTEVTANVIAEGGTEQFTYPELLKRLYPFAAQIQAHTERDETVFEAQVPRRALETFYPLFRDVLLTPRLDTEAFSRIRTRSVSDLVDDLRGGDDELLGKEALESLLYEKHPYGHPPVGTDHGLAALTLEDVKAHRSRVFCRERVWVGLAGGYPQSFEGRLAADMDRLPACESSRPALPPAPSWDGPRVLLVNKRTADATAISIGFPIDITRASEAYPTALFVSNYLGLHRQFGGLLFQTIREARGLNYGDYAYAEYFEQDGWSRYMEPNVVRREQLASIWLRPVKPQNALFVLKAALTIYRHLLDRGIPKAEINRYAQFLSRYLQLEQQTETRRLGFALDDQLYGLKLPYNETLLGAWKGLDEGKIRSVIEKYFVKNNLAIAIVTRDASALKEALLSGKQAALPVYDSPKPANVLAEDSEFIREPLVVKPADIRIVSVEDLFH